MTYRYMAELAPVPRLLMDELPPAGTYVWLITKFGTGYKGRYNSADTHVVAWCPLPKLTSEQKIRLRSMGYEL